MFATYAMRHTCAGAMMQKWARQVGRRFAADIGILLINVLGY
jgi:hypothetical protein